MNELDFLERRISMTSNSHTRNVLERQRQDLLDDLSRVDASKELRADAETAREFGHLDLAAKLEKHADFMDPPPEVVHNRDGLPMRVNENVPMAGGMDIDNKTSVHDKSIPEFLECEHECGELRPFNLWESHDYHERIEKANMHLGYDTAHRVATEAEHARQRQLGFNPNEIADKSKEFINQAEHRAKAETDYQASVTLDNHPYVDMGEEDSLQRGREEADERIYLDRDRNVYFCPSPIRLLDEFDMIVAEADKGYAVIEPNSAMVFERGRTESSAKRAALREAKTLGVSALRKRFNAEPPLSQQQLLAHG